MSLMLFASMSAIMFVQDAPVLVVNSAAPSQTLFRSRYLSNGQELVTISRDNHSGLGSGRSDRPPRILRYPDRPRSHWSTIRLGRSRDDVMSRWQAIFSRSLRGQVYLLSLQTGEVLRALVGHKAICLQRCILADGKYLATACEDKTSKVFDVETGQEVPTWRAMQTSSTTSSSPE